ncbi:MAG TPA: efflux RND transporter permease subunit, partial [Bacteroidales bacterium]|nr:efflux RND transporter permease subunit [Bacteroidales bacterium]
MIRFLINRPIAVCMTFVAVVMLGLVAYKQLPISLMPDIDIPEITVQADYPNSSARELENAVTKNLRSQLMQVAHLRDIVSETRDGNVIIRMSFDYGTSIDYAFIEVNEKIDGAMDYLPRDMDRPRVMKASATDLPVFYLNVSLKSDSSSRQNTNSEITGTRFLEMSQFCEKVIRRRIEQLPEVAMVDITGTVDMQVLIVPDRQKLESMRLSYDAVQQAIIQSNLSPGSILVHEGYYQYQIQFESQLRTIDDIKNIYLPIPDRLIQLKDIATVSIQPRKPRGYFLTGNQPGISMAIIQQADSRMADLKVAMGKLVSSFEKDYPDLQFETVRDQSELLDFSMSNLQQDLLMGAIMAFLILFLFLNDFRAPVLIGITIPLSLIISFLFFHVMKLSINIISLAGLALGIGMIIDCSIIVIENILYYRGEGVSLKDACIRGTSEVIRPMLSSTLSTSAVFLPLIFISGMAGALFYDEAVSVSLGNLASFIVAITILPVLFFLFYRKRKKSENKSPGRLKRLLSERLQKINVAHRLENLYEKGVDWVFRYKILTTVLFIVLVLMSILFFRILPKEAMPRYKQTETLVKIEWNENIHIDENKRRNIELVQKLRPFLTVSNSMPGEKQFLLDRNGEQDYFETELYLKVRDSDQLPVMKDSILALMSRLYPTSKVSFGTPENIFERIFADNDAPLLAKVSVTDADQFNPDSLVSFAALADASVATSIPNRIPLKQNIAVSVDQEKLLLYKVDYSSLVQALNTAFSENNFTTLRSYQQFMPVVLGDEPQIAGDILENLKVPCKTGELIPVAALIKVKRDRDIKIITAGQQGEYIPLQYQVDEDKADVYKSELKQLVKKKQYPDVQFSGSLMKSRKLIAELSIVLIISLLLLYFILAAQFESLTQPFIVLLELPADITGALFLLWITGGTLNIMSGIGIIIMSGVIINDSILKVDTINQLRSQGLPLMEAIGTGGKLRLGSILMTAMTTMLAVVPFFFGNDLGSSLQKPLSLALIGGMLVGTLVSLFFVPLVYWSIYRNEKVKDSSAGAG